MAQGNGGASTSRAAGQEESGLTGQQRKKARLRTARQIEHQLYSHGSSASRGNDALPPILQVDKFIEARKFEIAAMQRAIRQSKNAGAQRAFQSLPRALRRRAASHDVRRLPVRLRHKARSEMTKDAAKPKKANRKLIGKRKFLLKRFTTPSLRFARRQASKGWLETHVWHAKRMHMRTTSFGFRLATKPTMKAYRATARAAVSGALVHDASYVRHLVIESHNLDALVALIDTLAGATCKPRPGAKRFLSGARACDFVALKAADSLEDAQRVPLGPVAVIWDAQDNEDEMDVDNERKKKKQRSPRHRVLLRCHPLILSPLRTTLDVLRSSLASSSAPSASVDVRELELLSFDLTGKQSTDVLKRAFQLAKDHRADNNGSGSAAANESKAAAWRALDFHAGPQAVPRGMVLSVQVWDPRLSFPPAHRSTSQATAGANDETLLVPSKALARTTDEQQFWRKSDATAAAAAAPKPRQTKAQLDRRRSRLLIPGQRLTPVIGLDESLPLALVQRTYGGGGSGGEEDDALHGWTVLAPRGWGMAIWMSFVHGGARVAGLEQMDQVAHESLAPRFPADWPLLADDVRGSYEREWTTEKMERWVRRPPLKRADYARLGNTTVEHALESDLRKILRGADDDDDEPWLLFGRPLSLVGDALAQFVREGNAQSTADVLKACGEVIAREWHKDAEAQDAVVRVCIEPVSRGTVSENAMIYLAPDGYDLSQAQVYTSEMGLQEIGRATSGSYSLRRGRWHALGALTLKAYAQAALGRSRRTSALLGGVLSDDTRVVLLTREHDSNRVYPAYVSLLP